jgi:UDP-glucose 4-epimerase
MNFSGERVLITGGAGFVGSNLTRRCLELGAHVRVLDDFFTGQRDSLPLDNPNLELVEGSVTDAQLVTNTIADRTLVLHAACRNIIVSTRNPREDFETNVGGTLNVLIAVQHNRNVRRVVYTSSASVYGNPRYLPINEDDQTNMLSPYAASKFAGENYCRAFYESYGLSAAVVRYSNVFGVGQRADNPYCGVVSKFFDAAATGRALHIHGDGEQTRDYTYVDDTVEATLTALVAPKAEGQCYNVGTGREVSVNQLAAMVIRTAGSDSQIEYVDRRDIDNIRRRAMNIEKIRRELRWVPSVTIERGLAKTWAWMQAMRGDGE